MTTAKSGHFLRAPFCCRHFFRCEAFTSAYLVFSVDCRHAILRERQGTRTNRRKRETTAKKRTSAQLDGKGNAKKRYIQKETGRAKQRTILLHVQLCVRRYFSTRTLLHASPKSHSAFTLSWLLTYKQQLAWKINHRTHQRKRKTIAKKRTRT